MANDRFRNTPERQLWQGVLVRALMDAMGRDNLDRMHAHNWLTTPSRDFNEICSLAGFEPSFIRKSYISGRISYATLSGNYQQTKAA